MAEPKKAGSKPVVLHENFSEYKPLASAAASGDPTVHQLLAERQTAVLNGDTDRASALDAQLAALGYC